MENHQSCGGSETEPFWEHFQPTTLIPIEITLWQDNNSVIKNELKQKKSLLFKSKYRLRVVYNNDSVAVTNKGWVTLWICVTGPWGLHSGSGGMIGRHTRSVDQKYGPHHDFSIAGNRRVVSPVWGQTLKWLSLKKPILLNVQDSRELKGNFTIVHWNSHWFVAWATFFLKNVHPFK